MLTIPLWRRPEPFGFHLAQSHGLAVRWGTTWSAGISASARHVAKSPGLKGLVLPIGGLKEKIIAAKQAGIKTVILPHRNKKDIEDLPKEAKSKIKFTFVKNANEILKIALRK